jgi:hypothetical protein
MKMDKQTQLYVGLGVVAVAGYLMYANNKKKQEVQVLAGSVPPAAKSFSGNVTTDVVGRRKVGMVGLDATMRQNAQVKDGKFAWGNFSAQNEKIKDGSWASAEGDNIAPNFFNVHDSKNSFRNR